MGGGGDPGAVTDSSSPAQAGIRGPPGSEVGQPPGANMGSPSSQGEQAPASTLKEEGPKTSWSMRKLETSSSMCEAKSPEQSANFLSMITFWWLGSLIHQGFKRPLEMVDLPPLPEYDFADNVSERFSKNWAVQEEKPKPSVLRAVSRTVWRRFLAGGILRFVSDCLNFLPSVFFNAVLQYIQGRPTGNFMYRIFGDKYGWYAAAALLLIPTIRSLVENQFYQTMFRLGVQVKTALITTVYQKSLRLSNSARQTKSVGEIVTLMQVDTDKVSQTAPFLHTTWSGLFQIAGNIGLLIYYVGWSALAGIACLIITVPSQGRIVNRMMVMQRRIMLNTTRRVKILNEVLQGIKVVKAYAWERPFRKEVGAVRGNELTSMRSRVFLRALQMAIMLATPSIIMVVTFAFYAGVAKKDLNAAVVFTALSLFNQLRMPLMMYPFVINAVLAGQVSLKRLNAFMQLDELRAYRNRKSEGATSSKVSHTGAGDVMVEVSSASFQWAAPAKEATIKGGEKDVTRKERKAAKKQAQVASKSPDPSVPEPEPFSLENITLHVKKGDMLAVVGPVGSGKSSLAAALLGEMDQLSGAPVVMKGELGYCTQQAWIMNTTLRENVLFGREFDEQRYNAVVSACALDADLAVLKDGDMTEIGERGINLSGGQKQRVSLARAIYADADVYILDDPLSAVDAHVGEHLFKQAITGMLAGKTRIFVTNQLQYVPSADSIVVLKDGKIVQQGTYEELMSEESEFETLMKASGAKSNSITAGDGPAMEIKAGAGHVRMRTGQEETQAQKKAIVMRAKGAKEDAGSEKGKLVNAEARARGTLSLTVYKRFWGEASNVLPLLLAVLFCFVQCVDAFANYWLSYWTADKFHKGNVFYLAIYAGLALTYALVIYIRTLALSIFLLMTSKLLHEGILHSILRAPMSFFDTTPVGRILNRFSADISAIDENLPQSWSMVLNILFSVAGSFVVISIVTPWFILVVVPIGVLYAFMQQVYRRTARELKRLEAVSRSPIYSQFTETLNGLATIRAYKQEERFIIMNNVKMDVNNRAFFLLRCCDRWLSVRLEFMGNILVFAAACLAVASRNSLYAGLAGISINYALQITASLGMLVRQLTDTENQMNAVERIYEYRDHIEHEKPDVIEETRPAKDWPSAGTIAFKAVSMRYRPGLRLVLKNVSLDVRGGEKVGVVGRTGSGKSSLMLLLFRLVEPADGIIQVDGVDISKLGLEDLRSRLSIIPQDPVLFSGTIRTNLDPFSTYSDADLWSALERAHLKDKVSALKGKLEAEVVEYGENFSVGERQLLCLARVLLRNSRILVMDEATSSVDFETDRLIQHTIRTYLKETTMLIIAHRLNTVIDASRVLLLEDGELMEYDTPANLLEKPGGRFNALVQATGEESAEHLRKVARGEMDFFQLYSQLRRSSGDGPSSRPRTPVVVEEERAESSTDLETSSSGSSFEEREGQVARKRIAGLKEGSDKDGSVIDESVAAGSGVPEPSSKEEEDVVRGVVVDELEEKVDEKSEEW